MIWYTSNGTHSEREVKEYATAAGAKFWCRRVLAEHKEWADRYNPELATELAELSKQIDETNFAALPPRTPMVWEATDDHTNMTFVVEVWTENT
jgi:hypothetical protein